MQEFIIAIGLVLVIEGVCYALFPNAMKNMMKFAIEQDNGDISKVGIAAALVGVVIIYSMK